jgi:Zn-dependent alcohol dehydrogenase
MRRITPAVVESKDGPFELEEVEIDDPRPDEILVKSPRSACATRI